MIRSMTGYGMDTQIREGKSLTVEIRSVNHRYCEINVRLPKKLFYLENSVRNQVKEILSRGKIDIYISYQDTEESEDLITYNRALAKNYYSEIRQMSADLLLENDLAVSHMLGLPDLFISKESEEAEGFWEEFLLTATRNALQNLQSARETEGNMLKDDLLKKLAEMKESIRDFAQYEKESVSIYKQRLEDKLKELLQEESIDESRILTEVAIMADRLSIDEEIVRFEGHLIHFQKTMAENDSVGKKLDFIVQEMNREINTIASKSVHMEIKNIAIALKNSIEKIREQIQNIE